MEILNDVGFCQEKEDAELVSSDQSWKKLWCKALRK
jgi:hypothetical protein